MVESGITIVICCHNSSTRLDKTLKCIADQEIFETFDLELLLVDNSSTEPAIKLPPIWKFADVSLNVIPPPTVRSPSITVLSPGTPFVSFKNTIESNT